MIGRNNKGLVVLGCILGLAAAPEALGQAGSEKKPPCVEADQELNRVYRKVRAKYKDQPLFLEKLKVAQRAWIKFRDAHMDSRYPVKKGEEARYVYGRILDECHCYEIAQLTRHRTRELQAWLKGTEEGDGCSGSYKWDHQLR